MLPRREVRRFANARGPSTAALIVVGLVAAFRGCGFCVPRDSQKPQQRRELILGTSVATVAGAGQPVFAAEGSSLFGLDLSFLDPPPPESYSAPPSDAEVTPSGLASKMLLRPTCALSKSTTPEQLAKCPRPKPYDKVVIDYTGWSSTSGKMFDSSRLEKKTIRVNDVIKGWTEGLQLMSPGEKRRFWIPADLAYGDKPEDGRPAGMLVFDVDLYGIDRQPEPPETPQDVAAAPADATVTESGLAYKVLEKGTGMRNPLPESKITAAYSGWKPSGQLIMSTLYDAPSEFLIKDVPIKGLAEAFQLMVEGEKRRWWIPVKQASTGQPAGILVFDTELKTVE